MGVLLNSNWSTLSAKYRNFSAADKTEALVETLAEEMKLTVISQLDLLVYNQPEAESARSSDPVYRQKRGRTGDTRHAVKIKPGGTLGAAQGVGTSLGAVVGGTLSHMSPVPASAATRTVEVDPADFEGKSFYPFFLNRGTWKMKAKPFWTNSIIIIDVKRRNVQKAYFADIKARLKIG